MSAARCTRSNRAMVGALGSASRIWGLGDPTQGERRMVRSTSALTRLINSMPTSRMLAQ